MDEADEGRAPTRRTVTAGLAAALVPGTARSEAEGAPRALRLAGKGRGLPPRIFGVNSVAPYDLPLEDERAPPLIKALGPHLLRFPGGTVANYYDWRTGHIHVEPLEGGSVYRDYIVNLRIPKSRKDHPNGVFFEQQAALAAEMGAEMILVPNLETSTLESQSLWLASLRAKGILPERIEMGNEFYVALLMDKAVLEKWPDWATARRVTMDYLDAFRPHLGKGSRVAIQTASSRFHDDRRPEEQGTRYSRGWDWDDTLKPEPWFQAVTTHPYTTPEGSAGKGVTRGLPGNVGLVYPAMMARADDGFDRGAGFIEALMPDKEIWMTEWGGWSPEATFEGVRISFNGMWLHVIARTYFSVLRHPSITVTNVHALFFSGSLSSFFRPVPGREGYVPINAHPVHAWFMAAARGPGITYDIVSVEGARRLAAEGRIAGETYEDVVAGLFSKGREKTLLVQNASEAPCPVDLSILAGGRLPDSVATIATPDLGASLQEEAPVPAPREPALILPLPGYSLTRVHWRA